MKLPAELRLTIYELACAAPSEEYIDLLSAIPPPRAITLVCYQMYNEAAAVFHEARRQYWAKNNFFILVDARTGPRYLAQHLDRLHHQLHMSRRDICKHLAWYGARDLRREAAQRIGNIYNSDWDLILNLAILSVNELENCEKETYLPETNTWKITRPDLPPYYAYVKRESKNGAVKVRVKAGILQRMQELSGMTRSTNLQAVGIREQLLCLLRDRVQVG